MSKITELAKKISENAAVVESQGQDGAPGRAMFELRSAAFELFQGTAPPMEPVLATMFRGSEIAAVRALVKLGILSAIPQEGTIAYKDLASKVNIKQDVVERLCRFSATFGMLQERKAGYVEHSPMTKSSADYLGFVEVLTDLGVPAGSVFNEALKLDPEASEPDKAAFSVWKQRKDGSYPTFWEYLDENPKYQPGFTSGMKITARASGGSGVEALRGVISKLKLAAGSTIVDVGGDRGEAMFGLAESFPELQYVVQDRDEVVKQNAVGHEDGPVRFMAHSFFDRQPLQADVFYFRRIFHDWSDRYCGKIISALGPALKNGSRLLISDKVLPEPKGAPDYQEYTGRGMDMGMLLLHNGKERSLSQWKELVSGTNARLQLESVVDDSLATCLLTFAYV